MSDTAVRSLAEAPTAGALWPNVGFKWPAFLLLGVAVVLVFLFELMIGAVPIPLAAVVKTLMGQEVAEANWSRIIIDFRLPRAVTALVAGAALGVTGLQMQTLFRNPLASPWTLGLAAGAQLGVACAVVMAGLGGASLLARWGIFGNLSLAVAASIGSTLVMLIILGIARKVSAVTLLIMGLMFHYLAEGLVNVLLHFTDITQARVFEAWSDGTFGSVTWSQLQLLAPVVTVGLVIGHLLVKPLNALLLGENYARTLGLTVGQARGWALTGTSILAGAITAYCGPIIFLGVAIPHLCRGLFNTSNHRVLMPAVVLMGALLALSADLITHLPWKHHALHLNSVNALIGAPVVIWIILRRKSMRALEM